jgi:hypothetical protein
MQQNPILHHQLEVLETPEDRYFTLPGIPEEDIMNELVALGFGVIIVWQANTWNSLLSLVCLQYK